MRCPHCGEPVAQGQERCFACGEKLRVRSFRQKLPVDYRILILAAALFLVGLVGLLSLCPGRKKPPAAKARASQTKTGWQIQDSLRRAKRAKVEVQIGDSTLTTTASDLTRARGQLERLKTRYEKVKSQVLGETPTPQQRELMNQIQRELGNMQSRVAELSSPLSAQRQKELTKEVSELERKINNLISDFARAPKSR